MEDIGLSCVTTLNLKVMFGSMLSLPLLEKLLLNCKTKFNGKIMEIMEKPIHKANFVVANFYIFLNGELIQFCWTKKWRKWQIWSHQSLKLLISVPLKKTNVAKKVNLACNRFIVWQNHWFITDHKWYDMHAIQFKSASPKLEVPFFFRHYIKIIQTSFRH